MARKNKNKKPTANRKPSGVTIIKNVPVDDSGVPISNVGKVFRGETKYIDVETKKQRDYVVVRDTHRGVAVAKLKTIKRVDENGKNADKALVEINHSRYGLPNRTGVDFQQFDTNRMSGKPLRTDDSKVFPEGKERFTLSNRDIDKARIHTGARKRRNKKK